MQQSKNCGFTIPKYGVSYMCKIKETLNSKVCSSLIDNRKHKDVSRIQVQAGEWFHQLRCTSSIQVLIDLVCFLFSGQKAIILNAHILTISSLSLFPSETLLIILLYLHCYLIYFLSYIHNSTFYLIFIILRVMPKYYI